jgi:hypothetical protein
MDKVTRYRQIIQQVLENYAQAMSCGNQVQILPVCDTRHDQYLLVSLGWSNKRREHAIVFHAQLRNGQFLIEDDRTEEGFSNRLLTAGVAEEDIELAWATSLQADTASLAA